MRSQLQADGDCARSDCENDAVAVYEGRDPPAGTFRFAACTEHAPDQAPVRDLEEEA
jgi:hypothetical protein